MLNSFIFGSSSAECIMFFVIQMLASSPVIFMELVMEKETGILAFSQRAGYNGIRCKCLIGAFLFQDTFGKGEVGFMGQKDLSLVRYFEDQGRYADLINGFVFQGKQVVSEDDVQDMDSRAVSYTHLAAMCDTAGVALHGLELAGITPGSTVAVIGPGPIGMMAMKLAKAMGAAKVIVVGRNPRL